MLFEKFTSVIIILPDFMRFSFYPGILIYLCQPYIGNSIIKNIVAVGMFKRIIQDIGSFKGKSCFSRIIFKIILSESLYGCCILFFSNDKCSFIGKNFYPTLSEQFFIYGNDCISVDF